MGGVGFGLEHSSAIDSSILESCSNTTKMLQYTSKKVIQKLELKTDSMGASYLVSTFRGL